MMQSYEHSFAAKFGPDYQAFAFWKARVALYAILKSLNLKHGDEVIVPGYTCVVVPNSVRYAGAQPVYADIAPASYNVDPKCVEKKINRRTRVMLVQHTYGIPADMESLQVIAERHGLILIEDCAHVLLGSAINGKPLGSFGHAAFFSFQWSKPYTTGLGGMAVTREMDLGAKVSQVQAQFKAPPWRKELQLQFQYQLFRRFFQPKFYWLSQKALTRLSKVGLFVGSSNRHELTGEKPDDFNWRMSAFQHCAGLSQIIRLEENASHREMLKNHYLSTLRRSRWPVSAVLDSRDLKLLRFPLAIREKQLVLEEAQHRRIELGSWFDTPMHPLNLSDHKAVDYEVGSCPMAESAARQVINLPLHGHMTEEQAEKVIRFVLSHASPGLVNHG